MQSLKFDELLSQYEGHFIKKGSFQLLKGELIRTISRSNGVPEEPGIYLIYGKKGSEQELLYIGKAGTLNNDGSFKKQMLYGRINNKQGKIPRQQFYQEQIENLGLDALVFRWFITFTDNLKVLPGGAEAELLQAYFGEHNRLPKWNKSF